MSMSGNQSGKAFGEGQPTKEELGNYGMAELYAGAGGVFSSERETHANLANLYTHLGDLEWEKEQTDLAWSRNSPAAQLQQLMALGISKSQALAMMSSGGATAASAPSGAAMTGSASPISDVAQVIGTAMQTVSGAVALYQSCKSFGINLEYAQQQAKIAQLGAAYQQKVNEGIDIAGEFWNRFQQSADYLGDDFDPDKDTASIPAMFATIERAAKTQLSAKQWLDKFKPLYNGSMFAQSYSNANYMSWMATRGWQPIEDDQDFFADQAFANSQSDQLEVRKKRAEIASIQAGTDKSKADRSYVVAQEDYLRNHLVPQTDAQTGKVKAETRGQKLANRALACDVRIKEASVENLTELEIQRSSRDLAILKGCNDKKMYENTVNKLCDDEASAAYVSAIYRAMREKEQSWWDAHPTLADDAVILTSPTFLTYLQNAALRDDVENRTVTTGAGPLKITTRTSNAAWLYEAATGMPQSQQSVGGAWSLIFQDARRGTGNFWAVPGAE